MRLIIGESGGTKTDWVILEKGVIEEQFTGISYHPVNWSESFFEENINFWKRRLTKEDRFILFSAGCYSVSNRDQLQQKFRDAGLNAEVSSDLHAAGIAAYGFDGEGWVAIMGTGSVLFHFKAGEISSIIGGKGHVIGDEGSAYYFGKLVMEAAAKGELNEAQQLYLSELFALVGHPEISDKRRVAELSKLTSGTDLFDAYHALNINLFMQTHELAAIRKLKIIGSYAAAQETRVTSLFEQIGVETEEIIERPIIKLIERYRAVID